MGFDQYHEPVESMSEATKDFARVITSLGEEAEAISWYEQRIAATRDEEVKNILRHAEEEEFEHFAIDLEWISRKLPKFRAVLQAILFKEGNILANAEEAEKIIEDK